MDPGWSLLLLAAWVAVDAAAFLQIMVSQPLVAGWLTGTLLGEPEVGLAVGLLLQGVWARSLPLGGSPLPATGAGTVVAAALAVASSSTVYPLGVLALPAAPDLAVSLAAGLAVGEAGRHASRWLARHHRTLAGMGERAAERGRAHVLPWLNAAAVLESAVLGVALAVVAYFAGYRILFWTRDLPEASGLWVGLPVLGVGLGQALSMVSNRRMSLVWGVSVAALAAVGWVLGS